MTTRFFIVCTLIRMLVGCQPCHAESYTIVRDGESAVALAVNEAGELAMFYRDGIRSAVFAQAIKGDNTFYDVTDLSAESCDWLGDDLYASQGEGLGGVYRVDYEWSKMTTFERVIGESSKYFDIGRMIDSGSEDETSLAVVADVRYGMNSKIGFYHETVTSSGITMTKFDEVQCVGLVHDMAWDGSRLIYSTSQGVWVLANGPQGPYSSKASTVRNCPVSLGESSGVWIESGRESRIREWNFDTDSEVRVDLGFSWNVAPTAVSCSSNLMVIAESTRSSLILLKRSVPGRYEFLDQIVRPGLYGPVTLDFSGSYVAVGRPHNENTWIDLIRIIDGEKFDSRFTVEENR